MTERNQNNHTKLKKGKVELKDKKNNNTNQPKDKENGYKQTKNDQKDRKTSRYL